MMRAFADALLTTMIFLAFVTILVTAPTWGAWLDSLGTEDAQTRAIADYHQRVYESLPTGTQR